MNPYFYFGKDVSLYSETPVDIETFIKDDHFLGKATKNGEMIYPYWKTKLNWIFNPRNKFSEIVNASAVGTGKTRISIIEFIYNLYCLMCLRNPNEFFKFTSHDDIQVVIASVGKTYAIQSYNIFIDYIKDSPWFQMHGTFTEKDKDYDYITTYKPLNNIYIDYAYHEDMILGKQVVGFYLGWLCDKYNGRNTFDLYSSLSARVKSRTTIDGNTYGKSIIDYGVSGGSEILDHWKHCQELSDPNVYLVTGSQWKIKPSNNFRWEKFIIVTDGIKGHSKILKLSDSEDTVIPKGYKLIEVPLDFIQFAELEIDLFLMDVGGMDLKDPTD